MFHVVQIKFHGRHVGWEVWYNNAPQVRLQDGLKLKRHEAYQLVREWNG